MSNVKEGFPLEPTGDSSYKLSEDFVDDKVWLRIHEPGGDRKADIGILINHEGISIDVYDDTNGESWDPILQPYLLWGADFEAKEEAKK